MQMADVSVIIPVYNTEEYVKQCINSVLNQTYVPDEIILIDDGSTDNSSRICDEYGNKYSQIKVIHKENEGLGMARNTGLSVAECEYVMFLDSDDYINEDMVEKLYVASENNKIDLVKSGFIRTDLSGNPIEERRYHEDRLYDKPEIEKDLLPRILGSLPNKHDSFEMGVTCSLLRRETIIENKILFPSERELISEDLVFNVHFMNLIHNAKLIKYCGYMYRTNPNSLTIKFRPDRFEATKRLYLYVRNMIVNLNIGNNSELRWDKTFLIYLWMSIKQEKGNNYFSSKQRIVKICSDKVTREVIQHYPVRYLEVKQRIFALLIKNNMSIVLWGLSQC